MFLTLCGLFAMLVIILLAAILFTNALEHLGQRLHISEGVTGSLFAAIGTALPETLIPILALLSSRGSPETNQEIGVGAILGAPLMLATLSTCLMGIAALGHRDKNACIYPEPTGFSRDIRCFILGYSLAALAMFLPHEGIGGSIRYLLSAVLVGLYGYYLFRTLRASSHLVASGHETQADSPLWLTRLGVQETPAVILLQLALGLGLLVAGAEGFIHYVHTAATMLGISTLLLSLMIIPVATELPEKINSILWIRHDRDTLAFGNITGAMVFQGTLLPALGIALTPWQLRTEVISSLVITLIAACWLYSMARRHCIRVWHLLINGALYILYLAINLL